MLFFLTALDAPLYLLRRHLDLSEIYSEAPNAVAAARDYFSDQAAALLKTWPDDAGYLMPEGMTVADILLTTILASAERREIAVPEILRDYLGRMTSRPAYLEALARNTQGT